MIPPRAGGLRLDLFTGFLGIRPGEGPLFCNVWFGRVSGEGFTQGGIRATLGSRPGVWLEGPFNPKGQPKRHGPENGSHISRGDLPLKEGFFQ